MTRHERLKQFAEKHGRTVTEAQAKQLIREKHKGKDKTKLSRADMDEILIRIASDLGYLD